MCRSVRCIIFCFWQQLNIGSPLVGWPPLRRSPVDDCVALHVVANDVASGWLAAAPPCPCCGSACCSMLLLRRCRRRSCAVAVVVLSHAFPDPPDPSCIFSSGQQGRKPFHICIVWSRAKTESGSISNRRFRLVVCPGRAGPAPTLQGGPRLSCAACPGGFFSGARAARGDKAASSRHVCSREIFAACGLAESAR